MFSLLHKIDKAVKQVSAVLGARGAFRVVLYAEDPVPDTFHPFNGVVQKIDVGADKLCAL